MIELGPGTGVLTRALLARGLPTHRLALVEVDPVFARVLARRYPGAHVVNMDATRLGETQSLFGNERASAVISGLPLRSMPAAQVAAIIHGVFDRQLNTDGAFYQFTYGLGCPLPRELLERLDLEAMRIGGALFNLPRATVYRIGRRRMGRVAGQPREQANSSRGGDGLEQIPVSGIQPCAGTNCRDRIIADHTR